MKRKTPDPDSGTRGRPSKETRWTIEHAATEFGIDRRTLAKRLRSGSIESGKDGKYSTLDICKAVFGDDPRNEVAREQARNFRLKNDALARERIPIGDIDAVWDPVLQNTAACLKEHKGKVLTEELINEIFTRLREAKLPC